MRNRRIYTIRFVAAAIGLVGLLVLLTWANASFASQNPGGIDFLARWTATRAFLIDGTSPYSDATAQKVQTLAYGHVAGPGEDELRFTTPLYSMIVYFPFSLIPDFLTARAIWMTMLEVALLLMMVISIRLTDWRPNLILLGVIILFSLSWYHTVQPIINGDVAILQALLVVGVLAAIRSEADEMAGVLLAFSTLKPQVVLILIVFILLWALFHRRWRLAAWFIGTLAILVAAGLFLLPDWLLQNLREIIRAPGFSNPGTPGSALAVWFPAMGERLGQILTAVLAVILLLEWILNRKAGFKGFLWTAALTLVISQWIGIKTNPENFIVTYPALVLCFSLMSSRWRRGGWILAIILMLILAAGLWAVFVSSTGSGTLANQNPIMFFLLPGALLLLLYWMRWSALQEKSIFYEMMDEQGMRGL